MVKINWSRYIRETITQRIEPEERKRATEKLPEKLKTSKRVAPQRLHRQCHQVNKVKLLMIYIIDASKDITIAWLAILQFSAKTLSN